MSDDTIPGRTDAQDELERARARDLEFWKHFAGMGGTDKNTMITTASWLLAFAATAIGYIVTQMISFNPTRLLCPVTVRVVSLLGLVVSFVAGYVTLLYGGYANRNWAKADELACKHQWRDVLPEYRTTGEAIPEENEPTGLAGFAWRRARPCNPKVRLAPVFWVFTLLAISCGLLHLGFLIWSCCGPPVMRIGWDAALAMLEALPASTKR
jgi:hypothetical protein